MFLPRWCLWLAVSSAAVCGLPVPSGAQFTQHMPAAMKLSVGPAEWWRSHINYMPIFNGKDFDGWTITGESRWEVIEGAMVARPGNMEATTRGMLESNAEYANFILRFQYSIEPEPSVDSKQVVNSGVFFRVPRNAASKAMDGYEMEVSAHDDYEYPTGSIWRLTRSYPGFSHPNFWNDAEIYANGDYIRISVNGQIAIETFDRRSASGQILFQHQRNGLVRYRHIELMRLPDTPVLPPAIEEQLEHAPGEYVPLFNGRDLAGWTAHGELPGDTPLFGVENGAIVILPGSETGHLVHEGLYGDFILKMKYFMPDDGVSPDGNSGIFVRAEADGESNGAEVQIENVRDWHHWNPSGSIYGLSQGMFGWFKYNDWNEYTLYVKGDRMTVYLNGQKTASAMIVYHYRARKPIPAAGHIKIQSHEPYKKLQVKDILIKEVR